MAEQRNLIFVLLLTFGSGFQIFNDRPRMITNNHQMQFIQSMNNPLHPTSTSYDVGNQSSLQSRRYLLGCTRWAYSYIFMHIVNLVGPHTMICDKSFLSHTWWMTYSNLLVVTLMDGNEVSNCFVFRSLLLMQHFSFLCFASSSHWQRVIGCSQVVSRTEMQMKNVNFQKGLGSTSKIGSFQMKALERGWPCWTNSDLYKRSIVSQKGYSPVPPEMKYTSPAGVSGQNPSPKPRGRLTISFLCLQKLDQMRNSEVNFPNSYFFISKGMHPSAPSDCRFFQLVVSAPRLSVFMRVASSLRLDGCRKLTIVQSRVIEPFKETEQYLPRSSKE